MGGAYGLVYGGMTMCDFCEVMSRSFSPVFVSIPSFSPSSSSLTTSTITSLASGSVSGSPGGETPGVALIRLLSLLLFSVPVVTFCFFLYLALLFLNQTYYYKWKWLVHRRKSKYIKRKPTCMGFQRWIRFGNFVIQISCIYVAGGGILYPTNICLSKGN